MSSSEMMVKNKYKNEKGHVRWNDDDVKEILGSMIDSEASKILEISVQRLRVNRRKLGIDPYEFRNHHNKKPPPIDEFYLCEFLTVVELTKRWGVRRNTIRIWLLEHVGKIPSEIRKSWTVDIGEKRFNLGYPRRYITRTAG